MAHRNSWFSYWKIVMFQFANRQTRLQPVRIALLLVAEICKFLSPALRACTDRAAKGIYQCPSHPPQHFAAYTVNVHRFAHLCWWKLNGSFFIGYDSPPWSVQISDRLPVLLISPDIHNLDNNLINTMILWQLLSTLLCSAKIKLSVDHFQPILAEKLPESAQVKCAIWPLESPKNILCQTWSNMFWSTNLLPWESTSSGWWLYTHPSEKYVFANWDD